MYGLLIARLEGRVVSGMVPKMAWMALYPLHWQGFPTENHLSYINHEDVS